MVITLNKAEYKELVNKYNPKEPRLKNFLISFIIGGFLGLFSEVFVDLLMKGFAISETMSFTILVIIMIFIASFFTALGFFDNWVTKLKCGLIIPTTGFAHSVTSSALDYKKDGLITGLGANFFKLAGSVILYGIISSFILVIIKVVFYG